MGKNKNGILKYIFLNLFGFILAIFIAILFVIGTIKTSKVIGNRIVEKYVEIENGCSISTDPKNFLILKCEYLNISSKKKNFPVKNIKSFNFQGKNLTLKIGTNFKIFLDIGEFKLIANLMKGKKKKGFEIPKFNLQRFIDRLNLNIGKGDVYIIYGKDRITVKNLNLKLEDGVLTTKKPISIKYNKMSFVLNKLKALFKDNKLVLESAVVKLPQLKAKNLKVSLANTIELQGVYDFSSGRIILNIDADKLNIIFSKGNTSFNSVVKNVSAKAKIKTNFAEIYAKGVGSADLKVGKTRFYTPRDNVELTFTTKYKNKYFFDYKLKNDISRIDINLNDKKVFFKNVYAYVEGGLNRRNNLRLNIPLGRIKDFAKVKGNFYLTNKFKVNNLNLIMSIYGLGNKSLVANLKNNNLSVKIPEIRINNLLEFLKITSQAEELKAFNLRKTYEALYKNKDKMPNFYITSLTNMNVKTGNFTSDLEIGDFYNENVKKYLNIEKLKFVGKAQGNIKDKINLDFIVLGNGKNLFNLTGTIDKSLNLALNLKAIDKLKVYPNKDTIVVADIKDTTITGKLNDLLINSNFLLEEVKYKDDLYRLNLNIISEYPLKKGIITAKFKGDGVDGNLKYILKDKFTTFKANLSNYKLSGIKLAKLPDYIKLRRFSGVIDGNVSLKKKLDYTISIDKGRLNLDIDKKNDKGQTVFKIENIPFSLKGVVSKESKDIKLFTKNRNLLLYVGKKGLKLGEGNVDINIIDNKVVGNFSIRDLKDLDNKLYFDSFTNTGKFNYSLENKQLTLISNGEIKKGEIDIKYSINSKGSLEDKLEGVALINSSIYSDRFDEAEVNFVLSKTQNGYKLDGNSKDLLFHVKDYLVYINKLYLDGSIEKGFQTKFLLDDLVVKDKYNLEIMKIDEIPLIYKDNIISIENPVAFHGLIKGDLKEFSYNFPERKISIEVDGILNSDLLSQFIVFGIVKGKVNLFAKYSGSIDQFPRDIYLKIIGDRFVFRNRFLRDDLVADKLVLILKDGILKADIVAKSSMNKKLKLLIKGTTEVRKILENKPAKNDFKVLGEHISVRYKSIFRGEISKTDLKVLVSKGKVEKGKKKELEQIKSLMVDLDGTVKFTGRVHMNKEFMDEFLEKKKKPQESELVKELKKRIKLAVALKTSDPLLLYGNFGSAYMNVNVFITGTLAKPIVNGEMTFVYGKINLFGIKYNVDYFNVIISRNEPFVNARLTTIIKDTLIRITIYNTYKQPEVLLSSVPPKPQRELLAMLFFKDISSAVEGLTTGMLPLFKDIGALLRAVLPSEGSREETVGFLNTGFEISVVPEYSPVEGLTPFVVVKRPLTKRFYLAISKALIQNENLEETGWWEFGFKITERTLLRYRKFDSGIEDFGFSITKQFDF